MPVKTEIARLSSASSIALLAIVGISLVATGCGPLTTNDPSARFGEPHNLGHVDIFRGLGGYMPGSDGLQRRLAWQRLSSSTWLNAEAREVADYNLDRKSQGDTRPIILMGYAAGGCGARRTAEILGRHGVQVDAMILVDPSFFEPVPANVKYCFVAHHPWFWQQWNSIMRGNPVKVESRHTKVVHVNLEELDQGQGRFDHSSHVNITKNTWVQDILVKEAMHAAGVEIKPGHTARY